MPAEEDAAQNEPVDRGDVFEQRRRFSHAERLKMPPSSIDENSEKMPTDRCPTAPANARIIIYDPVRRTSSRQLLSSLEADAPSSKTCSLYDVDCVRICRCMQAL